MSAEARFMLGLGILLVALAVIGVIITIRMGANGRSRIEPPAPPTLHEIRTADLEHWDKRFYAVLEAALPGACNCDQYPFSCPIHARPPEKTYDLRGIHRHIENNRQLDEKRRARKNR